MKLFSAETVRSLIPQVAPLVDELLLTRRRLAILLLERDLRGAPRAAFPEAERLEREIVRTIGRIEAHGCIVKDIDLGLLDFPAVRDGRRVFLCWKAGEPDLAFWHGTDENFRQRKAL